MLDNKAQDGYYEILLYKTDNIWHSLELKKKKSKQN